MSYVDNAKRQEEEKRKREEFNRNAARITAAKDRSNPIAFGGASTLQAQVQEQAKTPQGQANLQQSQQRQAAWQKQREQMQAQNMANKAAAAQDERRKQAATEKARADATLKIAQQAEQMRVQRAANLNIDTNKNINPQSQAARVQAATKAQQAQPATKAQQAQPATPKANPQPAVATPKVNTQNTPKPAVAANAPAAGMSDKDLDSALTSVTSEDNSPISEQQGNKSYGLSTYEGGAYKKTAAEDFAIASAVPQNNQQMGLGMPQAPRRSSAEEQERQNLLKQATTVQKGARGITAAQLGVQQNLQSSNDKLANDNYQAQLGVASSLTQAQMREQGSNARAALGESAAGERQAAQLGFDSAKLEQSAGIDNRRLDMDGRKLDMEQENSDIANKGPKMLNDLYDKYASVTEEAKAATTDEEKEVAAQEQSELTAQIRAINGEANPEKWVVVKGESGVDSEGNEYRDPDMILNQMDGTTKPIEYDNFVYDYNNNPKALAIKNNRNLTEEQKIQQLAALKL